MRATEILFESRAAVLKAEAEAKLLDKQIELEKLRRSDDESLLRQALEALESLFDGQVDPDRAKRCSDGIAALRRRLCKNDEV